MIPLADSRCKGTLLFMKLKDLNKRMFKRKPLKACKPHFFGKAACAIFPDDGPKSGPVVRQGHRQAMKRAYRRKAFANRIAIFERIV